LLLFSRMIFSYDFCDDTQFFSYSSCRNSIVTSNNYDTDTSILTFSYSHLGFFAWWIDHTNETDKSESCFCCCFIFWYICIRTFSKGKHSERLFRHMCILVSYGFKICLCDSSYPFTIIDVSTVSEYVVRRSLDEDFVICEGTHHLAIRVKWKYTVQFFISSESSWMYLFHECQECSLGWVTEHRIDIVFFCEG
jgi:hypothetical protein